MKEDGGGLLMVAVVAVGAMVWFEVWPFEPGGPLDFQSTYVPEVGYRVGTDTRWWIGDAHKSVKPCMEAAAIASRTWRTQSDTRVVSIACRIMRGDRFIDRTRG